VGSRTIAEPELTHPDRQALLALARRAIAASLAGEPAPAVPDVPGARLKRGAFVTLEERRDGALRGCIGRVTGDRPLGEVVRTVAVSAALEDPRFPAVEPNELPELRLEISVLGPPVPFDPGRPDGGGLVVGRDGLLVRRGDALGVLLPQVATEHGLDPVAFLSAACRKAGLGPHAWREPGTHVSTFEADVFGE
jgi:AmmeMemoRadiSam system protein A